MPNDPDHFDWLPIYEATRAYLLADMPTAQPVWSGRARHALRQQAPPAEGTPMPDDATATADSAAAESAELPEQHDDYVYTDPAMDPAVPNVDEPDDDALPDAFPDGWGETPTERDQAAIDEGNA